MEKKKTTSPWRGGSGEGLGQQSASLSVLNPLMDVHAGVWCLPLKRRSA